jgi:hypothetical protein
MSFNEKIQAEELINEKDRVLKIPHKCFCCRDSGLVKSQFIHNYINGYGANSKPFICHNCEIGDKFMDAYNKNDEMRKVAFSKEGIQYAEITPQKVYQSQFDPRLNLFACNKMHVLEFELWRKEEYQRINIKKEIATLTNSLKMQRYDINKNMMFENR